MKGYRFTAEEQQNVRTALRYLHVRGGRWGTIAKMLCVDDDTIGKVLRGTRAVTPSLVFKLSRLVKVSMDTLLAGRYVPPGTCPHCGHPPDNGLPKN